MTFKKALLLFGGMTIGTVILLLTNDLGIALIVNIIYVLVVSPIYAKM